MQQPSLRHPAARSGISVALFFTLWVGGCGGGGGYGGGGVPLATLSSITITPSSAKITNAGTASLTAIGTYMDGTTADITTSATWTSTVPATASVGTNTGVVTASPTAVGPTDITAAVGSLYGTVTSSSVPVTVTAATLASFTVAPPSVALFAGNTTTLTATGTFADGDGNISGSVTWSSNDPAVATVNPSGIVTGVSAGTSTITAASGVSQTSTVNVF